MKLFIDCLYVADVDEFGADGLEEDETDLDLENLDNALMEEEAV